MKVHRNNFLRGLRIWGSKPIPSPTFSHTHDPNTNECGGQVEKHKSENEDQLKPSNPTLVSGVLAIKGTFSSTRQQLPCSSLILSYLP